MALTLACTCVVVSTAAATAPVTVSPTPSSVQPGGTATITAGMPVADAGTVSQEIIQTIDPTKAVLTGLSGIMQPAGWSLQYFDGSSWSGTAPATLSAWAQVTKVKSSGTINSQGSEAGYQIAAGTATGAAVNLSPATIAAGGTGDGYQAFFDPARTRIFNVFHHKLGAAIDCHVLATGSTCAGFPFGTFPSKTGQYSTGRVVGTRIWIPMYQQVYANNSYAGSSVGFSCVDIAAVLASGGAPSMCNPAYVPLATGQDVHTGQNFAVASDQALFAIRSIDGVSTAGSAVETRLWSSLPSNGKVICLDTATAAPCAGMPANGWPTAVKGWKLNGSYTVGGYFTSMVVADGRIYVEGSSSTTNTTNGNVTIACVLESDPSVACPGFAGGKDLGANSAQNGPAMVGNLVALPAADGSTAGVCLLGDTRNLPYGNANQTLPQPSTAAVPCWNAAGTAFTGPASLSTMVTSAFSYGFVEYQQPLRVGSRIYWGNGINFNGSADYPGRAACWDASKSSGSGGPCANLPATGYATDNYSVTPDPAITDCMWVTRHEQPNLVSYNMVGNVTGCSSIAPTRASFPGATVVPRMACNGNPDAVRAWKTFTLTSPAPSATFSATLTIKNSNGMPIAGWINVPLTPGTALDLSSLAPSSTGVTPSFDVDFTISSGSVTSATARLVAVGDAPELCLQVQAVVSCPAVAAPGPIPAPTNSATMALLGEGSATDAQSQTTSFTPGSGSLAISAPSLAQCSGTLNGQAVDTSPTPRPAAGITVALYDASGNVVVYPAGHAQAGQPVTTTTDASGNYSFANLAPTGYKVRFVDSSVGTVVSSTVAAGGSGTVSATGGAVTSGASTVVAGGTGTVNAIYTLAPTTPTRSAIAGFNTSIVFDPFAVSGSSAAAAASSGANFTSTKGSTRLCGPSDTAPNCQQTSLVTAEGTWTVSTSGATAGQITFAPSSGYIGTAPTVTYSVTDSAAQTATGSVTPTIVGPPTATADTSTGAWDANQTITVLANDSDAGSALVPSTVKLCPNPQPAAPYTAANCNLASVTIANEGTYTANADGTVTFDPVPSFHGQAPTPVRYVVQDGAAQIASALITPTVSMPAAPTASPESKAVAPGATATFSNLLTGLATGSGLQTGNTNGPCLVDPSDSVCKATFAIAGEGTWTVDRTTGVATFAASVSATSGSKTPVTYRVTDAVGQTATSTLTPIVPPPPTASPDVSAGAWDANQTITPLANDAAGSGATLTASTVRICATATATASCTGTTLNIPNEGAYTANADGTVTFDPLPTFTGTATPIKYVVADSSGQKATSTITPSVSPPAMPTASPESKPVAPGATATFSNLLSVLATGSSLQTGNTNGPCLVDPSDSVCKATFAIAGEGTWTVDRTTGVATFAASGSATSGSKTPVTYRVTDVVGQTATSTLTPIVPPPPTAAADTSLAARDINQVIAPLANDAAGSGATLTASTVRICATATATASCTGATLNIPNEGTYTANADGTVTFDPLPTFTGTATSIKYVVADSSGQKATSTITPTVVTIPVPSATPDGTTGVQGATQQIDPLANDRAGDAAFPLQGSSVRLCGALESAPACTQTTLTTADGVYSVDPLTGRISYVPTSGMVGTASAVTYVVTDAAGQTASSAYTPTVVAAGPPTVAPSTVTVDAGVAGTMAPQVTPGTAPLDPGATCLAAPGATCSPGATTLTRPEGTYVVDPTSGVVTFTPAAGYSGTPADPPLYCVADTAGQSACGTLTPTVRPAATPSASPVGPRPVAQPDFGTTRPATAVMVPLLGNDAPGTGASLVPSSVRLQDPRTGAWRTSVTVAGEGTYVIDPTTGAVTFTPVMGFKGRTTPLAYRVADSAGRTAESTVQVTVTTLPPPYANPDYLAGAKGQPVRFDPFTNDQASGTTFDTRTVKLRDPSTGAWTTSVVIPGQGTWTVDPATGVVTFTPLPTFTGTAKPITYRAATRTGRLIRSSLHPVIVGPEARLRITTTPLRTQLRSGDTTTVRLRACNTGTATAVDTAIQLPIPVGMAVPDLRQTAKGAPTLRGGVATWTVGSLAPGACVTRTILLTALRPGNRNLMGSVRAANATRAIDPATIRATAGAAGVSVVTG